MAAKDLRVSPSELELKDGSVRVKGIPGKEIRITSLSGLKEQGVVLGLGTRGPNPVDKWVNPFSAQFCEVEVNLKTGEVKVVRFLGTNDSGRVMNRMTFECQVFGGITMGIGLALTESRVLDGNQTGKMVNRNWHDYKLPTALDVPADMVSLPVEVDDPWCNSAGAKGLGEPATIPTAAALANALYNATGVRMTSSPMDPLQLCQALATPRKGG
jgi:CO/xanthine dehydrogenase Mo-binding subunit